MPFHCGKSLSNFLFYGYDVHGAAGLLATCFALAAVAILNEGVKALRLSRALPSCTPHATERTPLLSHWVGRIPSALPSSNSRSRRGPACDGWLYFTQMVLSYTMMLSVMSFNVWIFMSVVAGSACGYWVFGHGSHAVVLARRGIQSVAGAPPATYGSQRTDQRDCPEEEHRVVQVEVH